MIYIYYIVDILYCRYIYIYLQPSFGSVEIRFSRFAQKSTDRTQLLTRLRDPHIRANRVIPRFVSTNRNPPIVLSIRRNPFLEFAPYS